MLSNLHSLFFPGQVYPATFGVRASYSDYLQTVNSAEYEELFNNISAFVSDDGFPPPQIFDAILDVMQTERTHTVFNVRPRKVPLY